MIIKKLKTQNRPNLLGTSRKLPKEQKSCVHFAQTKIVELSARVSDNWFYTASDCVVSSQSGFGYSLPDVCHQKPETYYLWSSRDSFQAEISFEFTKLFANFVDSALSGLFLIGNTYILTRSGDLELVRIPDKSLYKCWNYIKT